MPARTSCSACKSGPDGDQEAIARKPGPGPVIGGERRARRRVDAIGRAPERNLAQRQQVALAEEAFGGDTGLLRVIDLACLEARQEVIRWQVDQLDFVGLVEYAIGDGLPLPHPGDLRDEIVEALEVLDIDCASRR